MTGNRIALDTNVAISLFNRKLDLDKFLHEYPLVFLPAPTYAELLFGAMNSKNAKANEDSLREFMKVCIFLRIGPGTAHHYASIRYNLKARGLPIPANDLWIAAQCCEQDIPLATYDQHFQNVTSLQLIAP
jgi:tRNA(fMet)-specific endonuclease VapC